MHRFNGDRSPRLRRYILTTEEWAVLEQLYRLLDVSTIFTLLVLTSDSLQPFLFATNDISSSTRGLVHEVIPYIDVLPVHLDDFQDDLSLTSAIGAAAKRGHIMLSKYYSLTDETPIFRIAMSTVFVLPASFRFLTGLYNLVMHPAYKLSYFHKAEWPEAWIQEARRLVMHEWTMRYKPVPSTNIMAPTAAGSAARPRSRTLRMSTGGKAVSFFFHSAVCCISNSPCVSFSLDPRATFSHQSVYTQGKLIGTPWRLILKPPH